MFKINFLVDCGSCRNVTETGGIIESFNFNADGEYNNGSNLNCLFTINAPRDKKINLSFTEFFVNECCDFINVSFCFLVSYYFKKDFEIIKLNYKNRFSMDLPIHFELVWLVMIIQRMLSHLRIKWRSSSLQMVKTLLRQKSIRRY